MALVAALTVAGGALISGAFTNAGDETRWTRHLDGDGALGSTGNPAIWSTEAARVTAPASRWTMGLRLCLTRGDAPAILDGAVTPTKTIGRGFSFVGVSVRRFTPAQGTDAIGAVEGYPPPVREPLRDVAGYSVTYPCGGDYPDRSLPYDELLLGFARGDGQGGGGWMGVDVAYHVGARHYIVSLPYNFFVCGALVPQQYCR